MERWQCLIVFMVLSFVTNDTMGKFIQLVKTSTDLKPLDNPFKLKGDLVFAHVIFRHGDRTPVDTFPTDPWNKEEYWPVGWGQLTNYGKLEHYHFGQWLRKRYSKLINKKYDLKDVYIQSTNVDRTLMSAEANLAGLYPPIDDQIWNKDIPWQPIPIHTMPSKMDNILAGDKPCKAYDYYKTALENSPEIRDIYERFAYLFEYVSKNSGKPVKSIKEISWFNNTLYIESLYNKRLPEWTKKIYPSADLSYLADFSFVMETYTRKMARLKCGPILKEMLDRFKDKSVKKLDPDRSLWIYSGHDTTIANVLGTLKLFKLHSPAYASAILFEMRMNNGQPYVSVFYKNNTVSEVEPLEIPNCGTACPLDKMYKLYEDVLPKDWEKECRLSTLMLTYEQANINAATGIMICVLLSSLIGLYLMFVYFGRSSYRSEWNYSPMA